MVNTEENTFFEKLSDKEIDNLIGVYLMFFVCTEQIAKIIANPFIYCIIHIFNTVEMFLNYQDKI